MIVIVRSVCRDERVCGSNTRDGGGSGSRDGILSRDVVHVVWGARDTWFGWGTRGGQCVCPAGQWGFWLTLPRSVRRDAQRRHVTSRHAKLTSICAGHCSSSNQRIRLSSLSERRRNPSLPSPSRGDREAISCRKAACNFTDSDSIVNAEEERVFSAPDVFIAPPVPGVRVPGTCEGDARAVSRLARKPHKPRVGVALNMTRLPIQSQQEALFKATAVRSPLPVMSPILPCPPCLLQRGYGAGGGGGGLGGGGRGHFIHLAIYCTTTWCFALKGLHTMNAVSLRKSVGAASL